MENKYYCIKGTTPLGSRRYIQLHSNGNPEITTKTGYRAYDMIVFLDEREALCFLDKFIRSDNRQNRYPIEWRICEYKPLGGVEHVEEMRIWNQKRNNCIVKKMMYKKVPYSISTIYGLAYRLKTTRTEVL